MTSSSATARRIIKQEGEIRSAATKFRDSGMERVREVKRARKPD
jgi:hypothetical protein